MLEQALSALGGDPAGAAGCASHHPGHHLPSPLPGLRARVATAGSARRAAELAGGRGAPGPPSP